MLTFPTAGEYGYICIIHPLMTGTVTVVGDGAAVDTQPDINERADTELNQWLEEGRAAKKKLTETAPKQAANPDGSTTWTYEMGATTEHTDILAFAPARRRGQARRQRDVREQQPRAAHGHLRRPAASSPRTRSTRRCGPPPAPHR